MSDVNGKNGDSTGYTAARRLQAGVSSSLTPPGTPYHNGIIQTSLHKCSRLLALDIYHFSLPLIFYVIALRGIFAYLLQEDLAF